MRLATPARGEVPRKELSFKQATEMEHRAVRTWQRCDAKGEPANFQGRRVILASQDCSVHLGYCYDCPTYMEGPHGTSYCGCSPLRLITAADVPTWGSHRVLVPCCSPRHRGRRPNWFVPVSARSRNAADEVANAKFDDDAIPYRLRWRPRDRVCYSRVHIWSPLLCEYA